MRDRGRCNFLDMFVISQRSKKGGLGGKETKMGPSREAEKEVTVVYEGRGIEPTALAPPPSDLNITLQKHGIAKPCPLLAGPPGKAWS